MKREFRIKLESRRMPNAAFGLCLHSFVIHASASGLLLPAVAPKKRESHRRLSLQVLT